MPGEFTFDSGRRSTRVMVRPGIRREVPIARDRRTLVVIDQSVADSFGKDVAESLQAQGVAVAILTIEASESAKSLETVGRILDAACPPSGSRGVLVSVGGGITGDLVGCGRVALAGLRSMYHHAAGHGGCCLRVERPEPTVPCLTAVWEKSSWCVLATLLCIGRRGDPLFTPRSRATVRFGGGPEARFSEILTS